MASKLGSIVTYVEELLPIKSTDSLSRGLARSRDSLKSLYLHYHSTYDHQTWQAGDLPRRASIHNVSSHFGHVVLQDHLTN